MTMRSLMPWRRGREDTVADNPIELFQRDMNRLFDDFFGRGFGLQPFGSWGEAWDRFSPRVDVVESDKDITVSAELPGLEENDIEVNLAQGVLTLRGEKRAEREDKGRNTYRAERIYGAFRRDIALPAEVDESKVDAVFKNGVLTITLPKTVESQTRKKIKIKSG